jgi:hypothetical protein
MLIRDHDDAGWPGAVWVNNPWSDEEIFPWHNQKREVGIVLTQPNEDFSLVPYPAFSTDLTGWYPWF